MGIVKKIEPLGTTINNKNESIIYGLDENNMVYITRNPSYGDKWEPLYKNARNKEEAKHMVDEYYNQ